MGHFFSKVSLFIDKKEAAAHLILDQDFATAPFFYPICFFYLSLGNKLRNVRLCKSAFNKTIL
mgnify:CR=1 FL=1